MSVLDLLNKVTTPHIAQRIYDEYQNLYLEDQKKICAELRKEYKLYLSNWYYPNDYLNYNSFLETYTDKFFRFDSHVNMHHPFYQYESNQYKINSLEKETLLYGIKIYSITFMIWTSLFLFFLKGNYIDYSIHMSKYFLFFGSIYTISYKCALKMIHKYYHRNDLDYFIFLKNCK